MTYSFPCQDLSLAGKRAGMERGDNTRSGLLWEVERILKDMKEKPQVLLMENVCAVHGLGNSQAFKDWQLSLERMGYQSYWDDMSAVDFGIPQTRNRTFMVSLLGDYNYNFPTKTELKLKLSDLLEKQVADKYDISERMIKYISATGGGGTLTKTVELTYQSQDHSQQNKIKEQVQPTTLEGGCPSEYDLSVKIKNATKKGYLEAEVGDGIDISSRMESHRGTVQKGKSQTITTMGGENVGVLVNGKIQRED